MFDGQAERGVIVCGSGAGVSIAANKFPGIRAAVCHDTYTAHQAVEHDDMNVLCIGSRVIGSALACEIVDAFLGATLLAGRAASAAARTRSWPSKAASSPVRDTSRRSCPIRATHRIDDLDRLVSELHQIAPARSAPIASDTPDLADWLRQVRDQDGSDLLLVAGLPPLARVKGQVSRLHGDTVERRGHRECGLAGRAIPPARPLSRRRRDRSRVHAERARALSHEPAPRARTSRRRPFAHCPTRIPRVSDLHFSHDIALLAELPRGLVLVCGPTGSGKTTTLAALIAEINARHARHIVTVEDPIEYEHAHGRSVIEQVEIGIDAPDFPTALRAAMRQAPDVIVVGEMRDPETMRIALAAAETGHLVLATVHATDAAAAVSRIADGFPVERQNAVRQELAMAMAAVLTQSLVQTRTGTLVPDRGTAAGQLRRPTAHSQERPAAPEPGDHHHAEGGVFHAGGVTGKAGGRRGPRSGRRAAARGSSRGARIHSSGHVRRRAPRVVHTSRFSLLGSCSGSSIRSRNSEGTQNSELRTVKRAWPPDRPQWFLARPSPVMLRRGLGGP